MQDIHLTILNSESIGGKKTKPQKSKFFLSYIHENFPNTLLAMNQSSLHNHAQRQGRGG